MVNPNRTCATCGAWQEPTADEDLGTCRLNPPIPGEHGGFPQTAPHWWCAKWLRRTKLSVVDGKEE
jgi:hypothetical protein